MRCVPGQFRIVGLDELLDQRMPRQGESIHLAHRADTRGCVGGEYRFRLLQFGRGDRLLPHRLAKRGC